MALTTTPTQTLGFFPMSSIKLAGAEISGYDAASKRMFVTSNTGLQVVDFANPPSPPS